MNIDPHGQADPQNPYMDFEQKDRKGVQMCYYKKRYWNSLSFSPGSLENKARLSDEELSFWRVKSQDREHLKGIEGLPWLSSG